MPMRPTTHATRRAQIEGTIQPDGRLRLLNRSLTVRQWADDLRISQGTVIARLAFGFTVADALTAPIGTIQTPGKRALATASEVAEETLHPNRSRA